MRSDVTQCFAQVNRVKARWSMQRINFYEAVPCSKAATAVLADKDGNQRHFCAVHQRMALQLRVRQDGTTPEPSAAADIRRIERRDRHPYDWGNAGWRALSEKDGCLPFSRSGRL